VGKTTVACNLGAALARQQQRVPVIDYARAHFDFILIDTPPNLGVFVVNSLYASDVVLVPNDAGSVYSLEGMNQALDLINGVRKSGNPSLRFLGLIINRVDPRTTISRIIIDEISRRFRENEIFKTRIPVNTVIQQAEHTKQIIFQQFPSSRAAKAYEGLAAELLTLLWKNREQVA
jgi:chromosome partitioning protein